MRTSNGAVSCCTLWLGFAFAFSRAFAQQVSTPQAGVYLGREGAPWPRVDGIVARQVAAGAPTKFEDTKYRVELIKVHYRGALLPGGLVRPTKGSVENASAGGRRLTLRSKDISAGVLQTQEFGDVQLLFTQDDRCYLVMTTEQLTTLDQWSRKGK